MIYLTNPDADTTFSIGQRVQTIDADLFAQALADMNRVSEWLANNIPVDLFSMLGMRNLSAFVSKMFAKSLAKKSDGRFIGNPHPEGSPDLLLMDADGEALLAQLKAQVGLKDKSAFAPFAGGGVEVKATCGAIFSAAQCARRGCLRPGLGENRIEVMRAYEWRTHNLANAPLLALLWDFIDGAPHVVAVFFGNHLSLPAPVPAAGGRRSASTLLSRTHVRDLYDNWIAVRNDPRYIDFIDRYNNGSALAEAFERRIQQRG